MNGFARGLATIVGLLTSTHLLAQDEAKVVGTLQDVEGTVLVKQANQSVAAVEGQQIYADQEVLVSVGSKALIVFVDGCDMALEAEELYQVPRRSPCASMWWAAPAAAGVACGAAHVDKSNNARSLAAVGLAAGAGLMATAHNREQEYREFAAALESVDGEVLVSNESGELEVVGPGTRLRADQQIVVRNGAKALIRFDDGCTKGLEVGGDREQSYTIPGNSPCFTPGLWWASTAAAAGLCVTAENSEDSVSP